MHVTIISVRIIGQNLPGLRFCEYYPVHIGTQRGKEVIDLVAGDAPEAIFSFTINAVSGDDAQLDFRGPFVHGKKGARFLYLSWGVLLPDGQFHMFRRAKLLLSALTELGLTGRHETGTTIEAVVNLTGSRGDPVCASLKPPQIRWRMIGEA